MPTFTYTALKRDGTSTVGELVASDKGDAIRRLERSALQPVSLKPKDAANGNGAAAAKSSAAKPAEKQIAPGKPGSVELAKAVAAEAKESAKKIESKADANPKKPVADKAALAKNAALKEAKASTEPKAPKGKIRLKRAQIIMFTDELSDLLGAGLQLEPALKIMESRDELSALKSVTAQLRQKIRDGGSFSSALRETSNSFGDLYCNMAAAGEVSGALPKILRRQAVYMNTIAELQAKVTTAMIYPIFLLVAGLTVSILFISYLIPQLVGLLTSMGKKLPLPAQLMLSAGDFLKAWGWLLALIIIFGVWGFNQLVQLPKYKYMWHKQKLEMPLFGPLLRARFYVQMLETMSNLVGNGLPLLRALELTRDATVNLHVKQTLTNLVAMVGEGGSLSRSMKRLDFFPALLTDMVSVGEQTGDIERSLERTAERYDKELQRVIDRVSALIQPAIILLMAILVGSMAYMMVSIIMETVTKMRR